MLTVIFSLAGFGLLELIWFLRDGYFLALSGLALILFPLIARRAERRWAFVLFSELILVTAIFFLNLARDFIFAQGAAIAAALFLYAAAYSVKKQKAAVTAFVSFAQILWLVLSALIWQMAGGVSSWIVAPIVFLFSGTLFFSSISLIVSAGFLLTIRLICFSAVAGFLVAEFYLIFSRLPLNLISVDFLLFIIYYVLWGVSLCYFSRQLTRKSLVFNALTFLVSFAAILASAKWFPEV